MWKYEDDAQVDAQSENVFESQLIPFFIFYLGLRERISKKNI
jgi:hypothetical protein